MLDQYLAATRLQPLPGKLRGIVVPHAGLRYSGSVAAWAFACLREHRPALVALVGPMHYPAAAPLLTTAHEAYATPLGPVAVDRHALQQLAAEVRTRLGVELLPVRNDPEHSLEMELPFLQHVLESFDLLPVMIHDQCPPVAEALGHALAGVLRGRNALLVASSDLSHYYPQAIAQTLDSAILRALVAFDPHRVIATGDRVACGSGAMAAVLWAARDLDANRVSILRYATSGDVTGDDEAVVGYGAAAIWQQV